MSDHAKQGGQGGWVDSPVRRGKGRRTRETNLVVVWSSADVYCVSKIQWS